MRSAGGAETPRARTGRDHPFHMLLEASIVAGWQQLLYRDTEV